MHGSGTAGSANTPNQPAASSHTSRTPTPPRPHRRRILDQLDALLPRPLRSPRFPNAQTSPGSEPDSTSCNNGVSTRPPCHCDGRLSAGPRLVRRARPEAGRCPHTTGPRRACRTASCRSRSRGAEMSRCPHRLDLPVGQSPSRGRSGPLSRRVAGASPLVAPAGRHRHRQPHHPDGGGEAGAVVAIEHRRDRGVVAIAAHEWPGDQQERPGRLKPGAYRRPGPDGVCRRASNATAIATGTTTRRGPPRRRRPIGPARPGGCRRRRRTRRGRRRR